MKFIHTSDWHLGKMIYGRSLLEDQEYFIKQVFLPAVDREQPDFVILAGDIYDRQIAPVEAIRLFDWTVSEMAGREVPFFLISGNHDGADRLCVGARLLRKSGIYLTARLEDAFEPILLEKNGESVQIFLLPYFEPAEARDGLGDDSIRGFSEAYEAVLSRLEEKRDPALPSVLVSHCFVAGSAASDSESTLYVGGSGEVGAGCFRNFTYAALGHLHGPQKAGANGWYSGSPLCYSFDEEKQKKGCTVVTLKGYETDCRQVPVVPMRPMRTLTAAFDQLMEEGKKSPCQDYVFLTLTDDKPVYMPVDQLREYYPNLLGLTSQWLQNGGLEGLTGEQQEKRELLKRGGEKEIFSAFLTSVCQSGATEEDQALFDQILAQVGREAEQ